MSSQHTSCPAAAEIITVFGGPTKFARWWWGDSFTTLHSQLAWKWEKRGFPRELFPPMSKRLRDEMQIDAPPSAWNLQDFHQQAAE